MVNVAVAAYEPVAYAGSSVRAQATEAELPALAELAAAPKVPTAVAALVAAICEPVQGVPGALTTQVYDSASPAVGGVPTDGPPAPLKSEVISSVMVPVPPISKCGSDSSWWSSP